MDFVLAVCGSAAAAAVSYAVSFFFINIHIVCLLACAPKYTAQAVYILCTTVLP